MLNKKLFFAVIFSLFLINPILSLAETPADLPPTDSDTTNYYPANTPSSPATNYAGTFRTCVIGGVSDKDIALVLHHDGTWLNWDQYAYSEGGNLYSDERSPSCDHLPNICLYGIRVDCTESPQGYAWKCINYDTDKHQGNTSNRSIVGTRQTNCSIPKKKIEGKCSTVRNKCLTGEEGNEASSTLSYVWSCFGTGGASTDQCEEKIPQVVDGKCGTVKNICSRGTFASPGDNGTEFTWMCLGENEGKKANCSVRKPFKGVCGDTFYSCLAGTSIRQTAFTERYLWSCEGFASSTANCTKDRVASGKCSTKLANTCDDGYLANTKKTDTANTWDCTGVNNGGDVSCSLNFPAANGICSSSHYRCGTGTGINTVASTDIWSWLCPGFFGGKAVSCTENMGVKKGSCSSKRNECNVGTPSGISEGDSSYIWSCIGPNKGGNVNCEEKKKTEGLCSDVLNTCAPGEVMYKHETNSMFSWMCNGAAGGGSEYCSQPKDTNASTTAICNSKHYSCNAGKVTDKIAGDKNWTWNCDGGVGGKNASCQELKPIIVKPCDPSDTQCLIDMCKGDVACKGLCGATHDVCSIGTSSASSSDKNAFKWSCVGPKSGGVVNCVEPKAIDGLCSTTKNACVSGSVTSKTIGTSMYTWACVGISGGANEVCSLPINPKLKVDGVCGIKHSSCLKGTPASKVSDNDKWSWSCDGTAGGLSVGCLESKKEETTNGLCSKTINACVSGKVTSKTVGASMYTWACEGISGGANEACSLPINPKLKVDGVCGIKHSSCLKGTPASKVSDNDKWSWSCDGTAGGQSVGCLEAKTEGTAMCSLNDVSCIVKQCKGDAVCEDTVKKCASGEVKCADNLIIIPGATAPYKTGACSINDTGCLVKQCASNSTCENIIKKCSTGEVICVKDLVINHTPETTTKKDPTTCPLTDVECLKRQCEGNLVCEDTIIKCVKGEIKCADNLVIIPGSQPPFKTDSCALNDLACLSKQCQNNLTCEDKIQSCFRGETSCVQKLVILPELKSDICASTDLACLLKKCAGNISCENALKKCKKGDQKCIDLALNKSNNKYGPQFKENNGTCSTKVFSCTYGTEYDNIRDVDSYKWSCIGKNGGYSRSCKIDYPKAAVCSTKTHNACDVGTPFKISETSAIWNWSCAGIGGGTSTACSMNIVPLAGVCIDQVKSCSVGKPINYIQNGDWNEWTCSGSYGGSDTGCFKEVKGSCSTKRYSCVSGTLDAKNETSAGYSWKCRGANGDLTVSCFEKKPIQNSSSATASSTSSSTPPAASSSNPMFNKSTSTATSSSN